MILWRSITVMPRAAGEEAMILWRSITMMPRAYAVALLGSAVMWTLANPSLRGWKAIAIAGLGWLLWTFSVFEAFIALWVEARRMLEAQSAQPFHELFRKQETTFMMETGTIKARRYTYLRLPIDAERVMILARRVRDGRPFTIRELTGANGPLTDGEFRMLQAELVRRGMLTPRGKDPRQGYEFSRAGRAAMWKIADGIIEKSPLPSPE